MSQTSNSDRSDGSSGNGRSELGDIEQRLYDATFGTDSAAPETNSSLRESGRLAGSDPHLRLFDTEALAAIVEEAKQDGLIDPGLPTDSIVCFCQALGLGAHALEQIEGGGGTWHTVTEWIFKAFGPQKTRGTP
ncbi:hypothetical protein [Candidatus Poriferisodalis sp.]|uniref:hypothetical protein n=1 Tax=Candidatus Poriferisodalis sp. TaxID=3101277 RepID=UPI003B027083